MMTLCIRYTLDANKLADFEAYAQSLRKPIERCGGTFVGYYLPTKIAGPTNAAPSAAPMLLNAVFTMVTSSCTTP